MNTLNQRAEDTVIAAMLAGFWSGMLMEKLDALTLKLNMPVVHAIAQWWPLLLIAAGVTLLIRHVNRAAREPRMATVVNFPTLAMHKQERRGHAR